MSIREFFFWAVDQSAWWLLLVPGFYVFVGFLAVFVDG